MLVPESVLVVKAKEQMAWLLSVAGEGNLYAEIQYHGMLLEEKIYKQTIKIAKAMNIPLVAANDAHMANNSEHDLNARKVAKFLHMAKIDTEEQDDVQKEMYLKSHDELASALLQIFAPEDVKEALDNADKIGDLCEGYARDTNSHYPVYKKGCLLYTSCKKGTFLSNGQFFKYEVSDGKIYVYPYSSYDRVEVIEAKE